MTYDDHNRVFWDYFLYNATAGMQYRQQRIRCDAAACWWCILHANGGVNQPLLDDSRSLIQIDLLKLVTVWWYAMWCRQDRVCASLSRSVPSPYNDKTYRRMLVWPTLLILMMGVGRKITSSRTCVYYSKLSRVLVSRNWCRSKGGCSWNDTHVTGVYAVYTRERECEIIIDDNSHTIMEND